MNLRNPKPDFNTPEPVCPDGQLQCRSGECLDQVKYIHLPFFNILFFNKNITNFFSQIVFCDKKVDCSDGSDENACSVSEDPNK